MAVDDKRLSVNMRTTIGLLMVFTIAIVLALILTIISSTMEVQLLSVALITPLIVLSIIFIYYCKKGRLWSYVGTTILGAFGVLLHPCELPIES